MKTLEPNNSKLDKIRAVEKRLNKKEWDCHDLDKKTRASILIPIIKELAMLYTENSLNGKIMNDQDKQNSFNQNLKYLQQEYLGL